MHRLPLLALLLASSWIGTREPQEEEDDYEVERGAYLYERNCSGCHGPTGAGDGPTALDLGVKPRNFVEGGFSFGNTREALFRTVSSGVPGRSIMPSFSGVLSDEDIWLLVDHVRTLMPEQAEEDLEASVMTVGDRPVIARGKLPAIAEGLPVRPRGLLAGTPEGMTFEYDVENVRLLGVRLGAFCDREDWRGRGGSFLRPLGQVVYLFDGGDPAGFAEVRDGEHVPLRGRLTRTVAGADSIDVWFDLFDDAGERRGSVRETCRFLGTTAGPAFRREFELGPDTPPLRLRAAGSAGATFESRETTWEVAALPDETRECVLVRTAGATRAEGNDAIWMNASGAGSRVEVTVLLTGDASPSRLAELEKELP